MKIAKKKAPPAPKPRKPNADERAIFTDGVVALAHDKGTITRGDVIESFSVTPSVTSGALARAVEAGRLTRSGKRGGTTYAFAQ